MKNLICLLAIVFAPHLAMAQSPAPETFVIETKRPLSAAEMSALKSKHQLKLVERLSPYRSSYFDRIYRAEGVKGQELLLQSDTLIQKVDAAQPVNLQSADPLLSYQWHLNNTGQSIFDELTDIKSKERKGVPGTDIGWLKVRAELEKRLQRDVKVAVIDSGLDYEHEEIVNQLYKNEVECKNGKPAAGAPKDDLDNNGYKGDCIGVNLIGDRPEFSNKPTDDVGHGTHVAGTMAATPDNGIGIAGLSARIKVMPIKILAAREIKNQKPLTDRVAEAILYATTRGVDVINMSLGWPISQNTEYVKKAIVEAQSKGILIVAAAGNNSHNGPIYPCAYKKVICVGSVTVDGSLSNFSNYGPQVDIVAPGTGILSLFPKTMIPQFFSAKGYEIKNGTSQAAPIVSGVAALLKGAFPNDSADQIRGRLLASAKPLPGVRTAGGLLRLDDSLLGNYRRKNSVVFKEVEMAVIRNNSVSIELPIESLTTSALAPQATIAQAGPQVAITSAKNTGTSLQISGTVTSVAHHHEWPLNIKLDGTEYEVTLPLIRGEAPKQVLGAIPTGVDPLQIRTLFDLEYGSRKMSGSPQYFRVAKGETGIDLQVFEMNGRSLTSLFQKTLTGETHFLGGGSIDADGDGQRDYLFFTYRSEKVQIGSRETDVLRLSLHYLNRKGEGIYGGNGQVTMLDENNSFNFPGLLNFKNVSFVRYALENGQSIMLPTVIERGLRAPQDQSKEDKRAPPQLISHIYYLEPARSPKGELGLKTRTLDSANFEAQLRKKLNLYFYEQIQPMMLIAQTPEMRAAGTAQYLLNVGQGEKAKTVLTTINPQGKIVWEVVNTGINVQGYTSNPVWRVGNESVPQSGTAAFGLITMYSFDGGFWDSLKQTFTSAFQMANPDTTEDIARVLQIFEMNGEKYVVYETTSLLNVLRIETNGRQSLSSALVNRSQFFSQFFSQVASSLAISSPRGFRPGLYIDNSQINAASIQSWDIAGSSLTAPISLTLHVPTGCRALNPVQLEGHYHYVQACKDNGNLIFTPVAE
jgi:subtilisin family serine protease